MTEESKEGTLDALVGQLTMLIAPLGALGTPAAPQVLEQLGLPVTHEQATTIGSALSATATAVGDLIDLATTLETAVESGDVTKILSAVIDAGQRVGAILKGFEQLQTSLSSLSIPDVGTILADLPERLFSFLVVRWLDRSPVVVSLLELLGIVERTDFNVASFDPAKPFYTVNTLHLDRIADWVTKPGDQLAAIYDWGTPGFDGTKLLPVLDHIAGRAGLPALYDQTATPPTLDVLFLALTAQTALDPPGLALHLPGGLAPFSFELSQSSWTLTFTLGGSLPSETALVLQPTGITLQLPDATTASATLGVTYQYLRDPTNPLVLISFPGGSRISVEQIDGNVSLTVNGDGSVSVSLGAGLSRGQVRIDTTGADGFIGTILGALKIQGNFDLGFTFSMSEGVHFQGSGALQIQLASHIGLGPLEISSLNLVIGVDSSGLQLGLAADLKVSLGPLVGVVQGIGANAPFALASGNTGNLGPLDVAPAFKPPTGIGLSIDIAVISGGGFLSFDTEHEEYSGALQLSIMDVVTVQAIGLLTTKMPDGSEGFSLLLILTADFGAGFQLGFGFTLNAVGGLVGVNRTMLFQPLMDGVRSGAIADIMFPKDVVANAPKIISDLKAIFPPQQDTFLVGPMAKLGWGEPTLVSLSLGIVVQIPPGDIAILGVLRMALPADDVAVLVLQVNFAGALEFSKSRLYFFASLFDSHLLFITIEGEMGLLVAWGDDANFVVSVGGFNPQFTPPPLPFPSPKRITVTILNESYARIQATGYFAVTSNTVQFGAAADLFFGFDAFSISGNVGFDALIQFSPFSFLVSFQASFSVKVFGTGVFGIAISVSLSGPTPWHISGSASLQILFFSIDIPIDTTWGDAQDTTLPAVAVMPILTGELGKVSNWRAVLPDGANLLVSLRSLPEGEADLVLHPVGTLQVSQRAVPLHLTLDKVGSTTPSDADRFSLDVASPALTKLRDLQEPFAPSQFINVDDATKLSQPAFEPQDSGIELTAGSVYTTGTAIGRVVRYDVIIIDTRLRRTIQRFFGYPGALFRAALRGNAATKSSLSQARSRLTRPYGDPVKVNPEAYVVANQADNTAYHPQSFTSAAAAHDFLARTVSAQPALAGTLHVLPTFEAAG